MTSPPSPQCSPRLNPASGLGLRETREWREPAAPPFTWIPSFDTRPGPKTSRTYPHIPATAANIETCVAGKRAGNAGISAESHDERPCPPAFSKDRHDAVGGTDIEEMIEDVEGKLQHDGAYQLSVAASDIRRRRSAVVIAAAEDLLAARLLAHAQDHINTAPPKVASPQLGGLKMAEKNQTPKIKAFGKEVSRDKAHQIIVNDWFNAVYGAGDTVALKDLLFDGWKPLDEWSDEELEDYIDGLCPENQIDGASAGCSQ